MNNIKKINATTFLYIFCIIMISYIYFLGNKEFSYVLFMIFACLFSLLTVVTSIYSLDAHKSALLCVMGSLNGTSLFFMSMTFPIIWFQHYIEDLSPEVMSAIFVQSLLFFIILFCTATFLVFNVFDKPLKRKSVCHSFIFVTIITLGLYIINITSLVPAQIGNTSRFNYYVTLMFLLCILTLILACYTAYKKNVFNVKKNLIIFIVLIVLSCSIIINVTFSFLIPTFLYMIVQLTNIYLFFRVIVSDSIIQHSKDLSKRLELYTQNSKLMNLHVRRISLEKEVMEKQYAYIDTLYSQMMFLYPDALFIIVDHHIYHINEHARKLLKYHEIDTMMYTRFMDYIAPEYNEQVESIIHNLYKHVIQSETMEAKFITATHESIDVELYLTLSHADNPRAIIVSAKDISDKKQQDRLRQAIELEKVKVEFFCTISHELKTPVNIIYSAAQLQNNFIEAKDYEKIPTYNTMIAQNCMRLLKLLNNFLDINRIESHYFNLSPRTLNVVSLTENILDSILPYTDRKNITSIFDTEEEEVYCTLDPDLMERILLNLFSNAIKYGHEGGHIWVNVTLEKGYACIHIKDDGVGIPTESQKLIFERFTRVENGLIRKAEGAGIGLSLVKSFVELNHGTIHVASGVDEGTEFIIKLPIETNFTLLSDLDYNYMSQSDKVDIEFSDLYID